VASRGIDGARWEMMTEGDEHASADSRAPGRGQGNPGRTSKPAMRNSCGGCSHEPRSVLPELSGHPGAEDLPQAGLGQENHGKAPLLRPPVRPGP
jgi:hypothetical protein